MKYDSSMKQYHDDILAAVRQMCSDNKEITEKFSPNDGSPAPLRDYLKKKHGKLYEGFGTSELFVNCHPTKGITIDSKKIGSKLELSWSQITKFIYDNWYKIFEKSKPKNRALGTLVKTFDETEITCPNWIPGETLKYLEMVNGVHFKCKECESDFCKLDDITNFFASHCNSPEKCPYNKKDTEETPKMSKRCQELLADNAAPEPQENKSADTDKPTYKEVFLEHYPNFDVSRFEEFSKSVCVACCFMDDDFECTFEDGCEKHWESECLFEWRDLEGHDLESIEEYLTANDNTDTESADLPSPPVPANTENPPAPFDYSELDDDTAKNLRECETVIRQETAGYFTLLGAKFKEAQSLLADHASGTFEKWYTAMGFKRQTVYNLIQRYDFLGSPTIGGHEDTFETLPLTLSYEVSKPDAPKELVNKVLDGDITTNAEYIKLKKELEEERERADAAEKRADSSHRGFLEQSNFATKMAEENFKLEDQIKELENRPVDVAIQDNPELMEELEQLREENARLKDKNIKNMLLRITLDDYALLLNTVKGNAKLYAAVSRAEIIKL